MKEKVRLIKLEKVNKKFKEKFMVLLENLVVVNLAY